MAGREKEWLLPVKEEAILFYITPPEIGSEGRDYYFGTVTVTFLVAELPAASVAVMVMV